MMLRIVSCLSFLIVLSFCIVSCGGDNFDDYREAWIGTYECTKSNDSFEDDIFTTGIEVIVEITSDSLLLINGNEVPVSEEGTFGPTSYEGNFYDIKFDKESIQMLTYPIIPGLASYCYIKGSKS